MTLKDIYPFLGEYIPVYIYDREEDIDDNDMPPVASYNGRDSIPEEFNDCEVDGIYPVQPLELNGFMGLAIVLRRDWPWEELSL